MVAIPITVISTNFNNEYGAMLKARDTAKARMGLLKKQFRSHRTGLAAVLEEVEELVLRNAQELRCEVDALFESARAELSDEVQEVVKMAFERRRQLHLAALAAGRLQLPESRSDAVASEDDSASGPPILPVSAPASASGSGSGGVANGDGLRERRPTS